MTEAFLVQTPLEMNKKNFKANISLEFGEILILTKKSVFSFTKKNMLVIRVYREDFLGHGPPL
jgi:hypothetical protein